MQRKYSELMGYLFICLAMLAFSGCATVSPVSTLPVHPTELNYETLNFNPPKPQRLELDNGLVLYLMEDHQIPLIDGYMMVKSGAIYEPFEKRGLASMTGNVMRTGGTLTMTGDELDEELEFLAASVETGIGRETGSAGFSCLKKDIDRVLEIFSEVILHPEFREDKIELTRNRMLEAVRRRNDDPSQIASREFSFLVYGEKNPWAWVSEVETVNAIARKDLVDFHKRSFRPDSAILAISGDFDSEEMTNKIREVFADWKSTPDTFDPPEEITDEALSSGLYMIEKDIAQANIRIGHLGISRHSPERFPVILLNFVLGAGGFNSRLMQTIRSDLGLAYSVWGRIGHGTDKGIFSMGAETKASSTKLAITSMVDIAKDLRMELVSDKEIERAKESLSNQFVFLYDSKNKIVRQYAELEYYGYSEDYLDNYLDKLQSVTKQDILNAAKECIHPDSIIVLAVGNPALLELPVDEFGEPETIEIEE